MVRLLRIDVLVASSCRLKNKEHDKKTTPYSDWTSPVGGIRNFTHTSTPLQHQVEFKSRLRINSRLNAVILVQSQPCKRE
jgi:hypothetical protein